LANFAAWPTNDGAVHVGFGTDRGTVAAASDWDGPMEIKRVRPAREDSYEFAFRKTGMARCVADWRTRPRHSLVEALSQPMLERAIGVVYRPETEYSSQITWKRTLIVVSAAVVAAASIAMALYPEFWPVAFAQGLNGIADAIFPLAVTAISLGIVGRKGFTSRVGRNEAWNHGGNVATAVIAGLAGYFIAQAAVLWIVAALSILSVIAVYRIDPRAINHDVARGEEKGGSRTPEALKLLLADKPLLWFTAAITLFHFANAAMLPLAGEKLSQGKPDASPLFHGLLRGHSAARHGADGDPGRAQGRCLGP
jgi:hypothetical protein